MDQSEWLSVCAEFEGLGESAVRASMACGDWKKLPIKHGYAVEWCRLKEAERAAVFASTRDEREEETLAIVKEANDIARSASFAASAAAAAASEANTIARSNSRRAWRAEIIASIAAGAAIVAAVAAVMGS